MSRIPDQEMQLLYERSGGYCEAGGGPLLIDEAERHHRKNRGSGGKGELDVVANLLLLHPYCHAQCHLRADRYERGLMVHTHDDPALVEVQLVPGLCGAR